MLYVYCNDVYILSTIIHNTENRQVVRLGAAACKNNLFCARFQRARNFYARFVNCFLCRNSFCVNGTWVSKILCEIWLCYLPHSRIKRSRRSVVQIYSFHNDHKTTYTKNSQSCGNRDTIIFYAELKNNRKTKRSAPAGGSGCRAC